MKQSLYLHIGGAKCASSFLQQSVFNECKEIHYCGPFSTRKNHAFLYAGWTDPAIHESDKEFQEFADIGKKWIKRKNKDNKPIVSSSESYTHLEGKHRYILAKRAKELFQRAGVTDIQIILIIRNQYTLLPSLHRQLHSHQHYHSIQLIRELMDSEHILNSDFENYICFYELVKDYEMLFGKEQMHILLYEELVENQEKFLKYLLEDIINIKTPVDHKMLNSKINVSGSPNIYKAHQVNMAIQGFNELLNTVMPPDLISLHESKLSKAGKAINSEIINFSYRKKISIDKNTKSWIHHVTSEGNRKLMNEYHLPLDKYGYPLPIQN